MKLTQPGKDVIKITDEDFNNNETMNTNDKVHLIKLSFQNPTTEKVHWVLKNYSSTNRFIVSDNIKFYNDVLKTTSKKYYVENVPNTGFITFFRKNNKVLLNFLNLLEKEKIFMLEFLLFDILRNVEIILLTEQDIQNHYEELKKWNGNVIVYNPEYEL
mgnify:CR=1 FL=1